MNEATHTDIIRRVEKIEIDVAVLDSKSNRLHQDVQVVDRKMDEFDVKQDRVIEEITKVKTYGVAAAVIISALYTILQIIKSVNIT